eukprot:scaffold19897_cov103-Isochrysis_galbana.AAC.2
MAGAGRAMWALSAAATARGCLAWGSSVHTRRRETQRGADATAHGMLHGVAAPHPSVRQAGENGPPHLSVSQAGENGPHSTRLRRRG